MTQRLNVMALFGAFVPMLVFVAMTLARTGGVFEYALDDVYIHLAMSEQVAQGGYGVNAGEYASASSSILYSYLLAPFAGFSWHHWWPLALGIGALAAAAILWARVLTIAAEQGGNTVLLVALALGGPLFMHFQAIALIGMEHMLHVVATLLVLNGLLDFARTGRIGWMLVIGVIANPLLRFEGISIALLACGVLFLNKRRGAGLALLAATLLPLAAHFWHMSVIGLDLLPNSVNAKAAVTGGGESLTGDRLQRLRVAWIQAVLLPSGRMLIATAFSGAVGLLLARRQIRGVWASIGWMAVLACLGHVTLGSVAEFYRYEMYVWSFAVGVFTVLLAKLRLPVDLLAGLSFVAAVFYGGLHYPVVAFQNIPGGGAAIHAQQRQMGLFVDRYWKAPVAVNDLGHVAYRNPYYVLDLWGLASRDALEARLRGSDPLWADTMAAEKGVRIAMVYKHWLRDNIPAKWRAMAELKLTIPQATLGGSKVTFYAITADAEVELLDKLKAFEPELPPSAKLIFLNSGNDE